MFTIVAPITGELTPPTDHLAAFTAAVGWFIGFSTLGAFGFYWLTLRRTGLTRLSSLVYLIPPTRTLRAWLMFGDPVTTQALVGLAVCALAAALVRSTRRQSS